MLSSRLQPPQTHSRRSGTQRPSCRLAPSLVQTAHVGDFSMQAWPALCVQRVNAGAYLKVLRAVNVTVRLAPLPAVTRGRTQAVGWLTCIKPAAVKDNAAPAGFDEVK